MRWPLALAPLLAAALAWALLGGGPTAEVSESPSPCVPVAQAPVRPVPQAAPLAGPEPLPQVEPPAELGPNDPEWQTRILDLPPGAGPLPARALIEAVERQGLFSVAGASEADLEALRQVTLPEIDRAIAQPYAALTGWLKEAGFNVELVRSTLVVRRRTDEGWTER